MNSRQQQEVTGQHKIRTQQRRTYGLASALLAAALSTPPAAQELPVSSANWVTSGAATQSTSGNTMTINQSTPQVTLDWQKFNIGPGSTVNFNQPSADAVALNRIHQSDPVRIFGALNANGQVYLINQNGIVFGGGAQVNVGALIASTLDLTPEAVEQGITQSINQGKPAFASFLDANGVPVSKDIHVQSGAVIKAAAGGRVMIFAPRVRNDGTITTPDGQTILAAGEKIYLMPSADTSLRGLLVEVDVGSVSDSELQAFLQGRQAGLSSGTVDQNGVVAAPRGNVSIAGLAVNQTGRVNATTSVRANGSIRLVARDSNAFLQGTGATTADGTAVAGAGAARPQRGGKVALTNRSETTIAVEIDDTATDVDVNEQKQSEVVVTGHNVHVTGGSRITANGGGVRITARQNPSQAAFTSTNDSRILVDGGSVIDVSGSRAQLPAERNAVTVELRGSQLKDSPLQRNGPLRNKKITVDLRRNGERADGSGWQGTPLADVAAEIGGVGRGVGERTATGGKISLLSQGDVIVRKDATLNVSGGSVEYAGGEVATTKLIDVNGRIIDISEADPAGQYLGIFGQRTVEHPKWGVTDLYKLFVGEATRSDGGGGYVEGRDAGTITVQGAQLLIEGQLLGGRTVSAFQRRATQPLSSGVRPFDQVPLGGTLVVGGGGVPQGDLEDFRIGTLTLNASTDTPPFDAFREPIPGKAGEVLLSTALFSEDGMHHLVAAANDAVVLPAAVDLRLPAGGSMTATSGRIAVSGTLTAPGGNVKLSAVGTVNVAKADTSVVVAPAARIATPGRWVNDAADVVTSAPPEPLFIDGGQVSLSAAGGEVALGRGSRIDVSGGGRLTADGVLQDGKGGDISLAALNDIDKAGVLRIDGELRGHAIASGGKLALEAASVCIGGAACGPGNPEVLQISDRVFSQGGFGAFEVTGNLGDVRVASDARVDLRQSNLIPDVSLVQQRTGADLNAFASVGELPAFRRAPVSLSLRKSYAGGRPVANISFGELGALSVNRGAAILTEPGGSVSLTTDTRMLIDGTIGTPGGSIAMTLTDKLGASRAAEFIGSKAIWLGPNARLIATAAFTPEPNTLGLRQGDLKPAGTVSLDAQNGYIVTERGSLIDVSGVAVPLDRIDEIGVRATTLVGAPAGEVSLRAAEGALLDGDMRGAAAPATGAAGGSLSLRLDTRDRPDDSVQPKLPQGKRVINVAATGGNAVPSGVRPGDAIPMDLNGQGLVSAEQIRAGGFDSLSLTSRNVVDNGAFKDASAIRLVGDVSLALRNRLVLNASSLQSAGGSANLRATYVAIGSDDFVSQETSALTGGTGRLSVSGQQIDLVGNSVLQGMSAATLASAGDVRLIGQNDADRNQRRLAGSLSTLGDLSIAAAQVYPTTLSDFTIAAKGPTAAITVSRTGTDSTVLSAGGRVTLEAARVDQSGVLKAPFGEVEIAADTIRLGPGSITSTSLSGAVVPFGLTQGGFDWAYPLSGGATPQVLVFDGKLNSLPQPRIDLDGREIDQAPGATIDLSGGGNLLAYEFQPGNGGSRDLLSNEVSPGLFAILPWLKSGYAPLDPLYNKGYTLSPGQTVHLGSGSGLPEGDYALLPARYGVLPGAFLVQAIAGYDDISLGQSFAQLDGSTVVAGYRSVAGTGIRDDRTSGFAVRTGESFRDYAEYAQTLATDFFPRFAARNETILPRLPTDAGSIVLAATSQLSLRGAINSTAAGRRSAVDITAENILLTTQPASAPGGALVVDPRQLNAIGAESLAIGARRGGTTKNGIDLDVRARSVAVGSDASLVAPEIIVAGRERVSVDAGAEVRASGPIADDGVSRINVAGDGALLRTSSGSQKSIVRTGATGARGDLVVASGASIAGRAVALDASRSNRIGSGTVSVNGGSLSLGTQRISIGEVGGVTQGLALSNTDLLTFGASELILSARDGLDLYGNVALSTTSLTIDAAGIGGFGAAGDVASVAARSIRLTNLAGGTYAGNPNGSGRLQLTAEDVELGPGTVSVAGFRATELSAQQTIRGQGKGGLAVDGDLVARSTRLTGFRGADTAIAARGDVSVETSGASTPPVEGDLGARLGIEGRRISVSGRIVLPSGSLSLKATGSAGSGDVTLQQGALVDVSGRTVAFGGGAVAGAAGGRVTMVSVDGNVDVRDGATIDVSGSNEGSDAGSLVLRATRGNVSLNGRALADARPGYRGGSFAVDSRDGTNLTSLLRVVSDAGFSERIAARVRSGDVTIDTRVRSRNISIAADSGSLSVDDELDASGVRGGTIMLAARDAVTLATDKQLLARTTGNGQRGGEVSIYTASAGDGSTVSTGGIRLGRDSLIDVSGGANGRGGSVLLRLPAADLLTVIDPAAPDALVLGGNITGAATTTVEGFRAYSRTGISASDTAASSVLWTDADALMAQRDSLLEAIGRNADPTWHVRPGVEVRSSGDLTLSSNWNLNTPGAEWRFSGEPGNLTLRAGGNLNINGNINDGFTSDATNSSATLQAEGDSWSYRLVGGADLGGAAPLSLADDATGDVSIGPGTPSTRTNAPSQRVVRTGTGFIDVAAAGDINLANRASVIYTAGRQSRDGVPLSFRTGFTNPFPTDGGDVRLQARGDVNGAPTNQLITDWLWRVGRPAGSTSPSATGWTIAFERFEQNVGALGGGDVTVDAGGSVVDLSAVVPSIGKQIGGVTPESSRVEVIGGGSLAIRSGGDVLGGIFYVGKGRGLIEADGRISAGNGGAGNNRVANAPVLALGDGSITMRARQDVDLLSVVNPTMLPLAPSQNANRQRSYFSTYGLDSGVDLQSVAGNVRVLNDTQAITTALAPTGIQTGGDTKVFGFYPPTLRVSALSGDIDLANTMTLFPSGFGNLSLLADGDIRFGNGSLLLMSDSDPVLFGTPATPNIAPVVYNDLVGASQSADPRLHASVPVHGGSAEPPARIVARRGSIIAESEAGQISEVILSKQARVRAGVDVRELLLTVQNNLPTDLTEIVAGRDIVYPTSRIATGQVGSDLRGISVDGPGTLLMQAGRNIDLQASRGIQTRGNIVNPALADEGADVFMLAGFDATEAAIEAFLRGYVFGRPERVAALRRHVASMGGDGAMSEDGLLSAFAATPESAQQSFLFPFFLDELRSSGRAAASSGEADFSRGFDAISTLFPNVGAYRGDLSLFFSRVYTLDGGDINIVVPGGLVNAGLAVPPGDFGVAKQPSELGVVVQTTGNINAFTRDDFLVNQSRVFAADGGSIMMWSSDGNIDAGRGAKSAISAPPPILQIDPLTGAVKVTFPPALTGSGIRAFVTTPGRAAGDVDLFAPRGFVSAGDAGIGSAGNVTIAAVQVIGADNIQVGGTATGVPTVDTGGLAAGLTGVGDVAAAATNAVTDAATKTNQDDGRKAAEAAKALTAALSFISVEFLGYGEG